MTLLVGVRCDSECVVLAGDTAATYGNLGSQTVTQLTPKIRIVADTAAIGTSGPVGLGQRLAGELGQRALLDELGSMEPWQAMTRIRQKFFPHIGEELRAAQIAMGVVGQAALSSALSHSLVAVTVQGIPRLFQFDQQGAPEESTTLPWVTCGSGQNSADAFVSFLRRIFWPERQPTREEAIFTALWAVEQGIASAPGGIGGSAQLVLLERDRSARQVEEDELQEHRQSIQAAERALAEFRKSLSATRAPPALPAP